MYPATSPANSVRRLVAPADEQRWLKGIRAGDERAFVALVHAYYSELCDVGAAHSTEDPAAVEELVHDVLLSVWRRRTEFAVRGSVFAYLAAAVRKRALSHQYKSIRSRRTREAAARDQIHTGSPRQHTVGPDDILERREQWTRVQAAAEQLTPGRKLVLLLRWTRQLSYTEIATALGISVRTAETQHLRAMQDLRRLLHEERSAP